MEEEEQEGAPADESTFDLSGSVPQIQLDLSKFNSVRVKDLKETCRSIGFSPKGNKGELVSRLLKHPKFNTEDDLVTYI